MTETPKGLTPDEQAAARQMGEQLASHKKAAPKKPLFQRLADSVRHWAVRLVDKPVEDPRFTRVNVERQRREAIVKAKIGDDVKTLNWMFWRQIRPDPKEPQTTEMANMVNDYMRTAIAALYKRLCRHYGINSKYFPHESVRHSERAELRLAKERVRRAAYIKYMNAMFTADTFTADNFIDAVPKNWRLTPNRIRLFVRQGTEA